MTRSSISRADKRAGDLVEAKLVPLEGGEGLVGARQDGAAVFEDVAHVADVQRDDVHRLRHGDDGEAGLPGDAVGGAVPGAGLLGDDGGVGHQVDSGPDDPGGVSIADDRAVHLGQLAQAGRGELDVEEEAAGRDRIDDLVLSEHDQRAGATTQDPLEALA